MQTPTRTLALLGCLLVSSPLSRAIEPGGVNLPGAAVFAAPSRIGRGGTVNAVDWRMKTIVVNGVNYPLAQTPVPVHAPPGQRGAENFELKPGMQIRFDSSKYNFSGQDQVVEIWVTDARTKPAGK